MRLRDWLVYFVLGMTLVGCGRPQPTESPSTQPAVQASPDTTNAPLPSATPSPTAASIPTATPMPPATPLPTATPAPILVPTMTPTRWDLGSWPEETPAEGPRRVQPTLVDLPEEDAPFWCADFNQAWHCKDQLLDTYFVYPEFLGRIITATMRTGGYDGLAYDYDFVDGETGVAAGGRSDNFSEGRGPMYTDQSGFQGRAPAELCADWQATTCEEVAPGVIFMVLYPKAAWFCSDGMAPTTSPRALIAVDLAHHPLIHGFGFTAALLPPTQETEWQARWFDNRTQETCAAPAQAEFDQAVTDLRTALTAGTADPEIQARYDGLHAFAAGFSRSNTAAAVELPASSSRVMRDVVTAVLAGDVARLTSLIHYTPVACTTTGALGGPPLCRADEREGTLIEAVPLLEAEGVMVRADEMRGVVGRLVSLDLTPIVAGEPRELFSDDAWLPADQAVIFVNEEPRQAIAVLTDDVGIVRMYYGRSVGEVYARVFAPRN